VFFPKQGKRTIAKAEEGNKTSVKKEQTTGRKTATRAICVNSMKTLHHHLFREENIQWLLRRKRVMAMVSSHNETDIGESSPNAFPNTANTCFINSLLNLMYQLKKTKVIVKAIFFGAQKYNFSSLLELFMSSMEAKVKPSAEEYETNVKSLTRIAGPGSREISTSHQVQCQFRET